MLKRVPAVEPVVPCAASASACRSAASAAARLGSLLHLALEADALRRLGVVAGRRRKARVDVQAAAVEILGRLRVALHRLRAALGDADELQEAGAVGIAVLAEPGHLVPEALHGRQAGLVAVVGEVAVDVVHLGAPLPRLDRAAARNPHRRMRLLDRPRPDVDVALLVEAAVEGEGLLLGPRLHDEVVRLEIALAQHRRVLAVGVAGVHRRADREAGDQPPARDAVDHREFFGHPRRRVVERERVAHARRSRCRSCAATAPWRSGSATASGRSRSSGAR